MKLLTNKEIDMAVKMIVDNYFIAIDLLQKSSPSMEAEKEFEIIEALAGNTIKCCRLIGGPKGLILADRYHDKK